MPSPQSAISEDGCLDERVAATYDGDAAIFDAKVVDPVVDFLADLASWRA